MTTICPTKVQCECLDEPIENLSGEGPDNPSFLGIFRPPSKPRLGIPFESPGCVRWCFSEVSQSEADACAEAQAIECQEDEVFYSAEKTCEVICPSGFVLTGTELAGAVVSAISQEDADTRAMSLACRKANLTACAGVVLPVGNEAQGVSCADAADMIANVELPANLSISGPTLTVAANSFSAQTLEEANVLAAQYVTDYFNAGFASGDIVCGFPRCGEPTDVLGLQRPRVNGSFTACSACEASVDPPWDGFLELSAGSEYCSWDTALHPAFSISGKKMGYCKAEHFAISPLDGITPDQWVLEISCDRFTGIYVTTVLWRGFKNGGDTPAGTYTFHSTAIGQGCPGTPPATVTITLEVP